MEEEIQNDQYKFKIIWEYIFVSMIMGYIVIPAFCFHFWGVSVFTALMLVAALVSGLAWLRLLRQVIREIKLKRKLPARPHRRSAILIIFSSLFAGDLIIGHSIELLIHHLQVNFFNIVPIAFGLLTTLVLWKSYPSVLKIYAARKKLRQRRMKVEKAYGNA